MVTDWGKEADEAADKTDKELAAGIKKLISTDLTGMFPNPVDAEKVRGLIKKINASTSYNDRVAAIKAVAVVLSKDATAALKKILLAALVAFTLGAVSLQAQVKAIDLSSPLDDPRAGMSWDGKGGKLGVLQVPVIYWIGERSGLEYVTLNGGVGDELSNGQIKGMVSIGPRIDNLFTWLAGGSWAKRHLRFAALPPIQVTVDIGTSDFKHYYPRLTLLTKIGGR